MPVTEAQLIIASITHGGTPYGTSVGFAWDNQADYVEIPDEGKTGPSAQGLIRRRLIAENEFLEGQVIAIDTKGSLVITINAKDGGLTTETMTNMLASTYSNSSGGVPFRKRQQHIHEGDMDADPLTISE